MIKLKKYKIRLEIQVKKINISIIFFSKCEFNQLKIQPHNNLVNPFKLFSAPFVKSL